MANRLTTAWKALTNTATPQQVALVTAASTGDGRPMGPGLPLSPNEGYRPVGGPRQYDYRVGANIKSRADRDGRISFDTLKGIIDAYDVAQMCITHRIDDVRSLDWTVVPKRGINQQMPDVVDLAYQAMESPDGVNDFASWLSMYLEDVLRYDAGALYRRRDRANRVCALEVIDGTTLSPIIDYYGRRPTGDAPAFTQFIQGQPFTSFTAADVIYQPFRPSASSPYGRPAIESILLAANTDLRFQQHFLRFFTEGSVPFGFAMAPEGLDDPQMIAQWQEQWDAILTGDEAAKHQIKWVPAGTAFEFPAEQSFDSAFPEYLMMKVCAAFHVTPSDLGFTQDVNRATGEVQKDIQFRTGTMPLVQHCQRILTRYLQKDLGLPVEFQFDTGADDEDALSSAQVDGLMIDHGVISIDEVRTRRYGLAIDDGRPTPRFVMTTHSGPVPLVSLFDVAGPIDPETAAPDEDEPLQVAAFTGADGIMAYKAPGGQQFTKAPLDPDDPMRPELENPVAGSGVINPPTAAAPPLVKELRKWRDNARTRADRGQTPRPFQSDVIPPEVHDVIAKALATATSRADVDAVFGVVLGKPQAVTKSWRDQPPVAAPQHAADLVLTDYWTPRVTAALLTLFTPADLTAAILAAQAIHGQVRKDDTATADEGGDEVGNAMRDKIRQVLGTKMSTADLETVLRRAWADAYLAGGLASGQALTDGGLTVRVSPTGTTAGINWADWTPGNPDAAALADNGGWQAALTRAGITLDGITATTLDRVANSIVDGLTAGSTIDDVAAGVTDVIGDPTRAEMIAHTETARMLTDASLATYGANGVAQWDWVISAGACTRCLAGEAGNPYPVAEGGLIPAHPHCRCAAAPHVSSE